jgi:hypothetical protein
MSETKEKRSATECNAEGFAVLGGFFIRLAVAAEQRNDLVEAQSRRDKAVHCFDKSVAYYNALKREKEQNK